jgi:ParB-like chromosome segregation protein Spo0J
MSDVARQTTAELSGEMDVKLLKLGMSPRFSEQDLDHAKALAHRFDECPPIVVERSTSTVIDGVHRLLAARLLGRSKVIVNFFDGTHDEAYVEAVRANISHGKPLTLAEREAAAKKILGMRSDWSDRLVGSIYGLSGKTVGRLRKSTEEIPQLMVRVGRDGRQRPTNSSQLRKEIATALGERPDANSTEIAKTVSTSPTTVRDVRKRIERGESFTPSNRPKNAAARNANRIDDVNRASAKEELFVNWRTDSAILALSGGEEFAKWLDETNVTSSHWEPVLALIPIGRIPKLIEHARSSALEWTILASSLETRFRELNRRIRG